ncbi:MAG: lipoate--protein ligase family protein [Sedimentisphaerales bacterium]|nr:lipoate--protein ligase family protein [Sedimentisphaerales bacterium]
MPNHPDNSVLRVIIDPAQSGPVNMATDEAILEAVNGGSQGATLRFYQWAEPTISLGYFQKHDEYLAQDAVIRKLPMVRRQTGGGAILHDDELTYSLIVPLVDDSKIDIEGLYRLVHDAFIYVLLQLGVQVNYRGGEDRGNSQRGSFFCFSRLHRLDLVVGEEKLLGSAQRRMKNAVLQHGSLILARHFKQQKSASLNGLVQIPAEVEKLTNSMADRIALGMDLLPQILSLSDAEQAGAAKLQEKYGGQAWNQQR